MRHAFGKALGKAARVNIGKILMSIRTTDKFIDKAKEALRRAKNKLLIYIL